MILLFFTLELNQLLPRFQVDQLDKLVPTCNICIYIVLIINI